MVKHFHQHLTNLPINYYSNVLKLKNFAQNFSFFFQIFIMPKHVTSCGAHLRGLAPGLHSFEETSQRWQVVGDIVSI